MIHWLLVLAVWLFSCVDAVVAAQNCADFAGAGCSIVIGPHMSFVKSVNRPVTKIAIADAQVADAELLTTTQILLIAKDKTGITSLTLWHGDGHAEVYQVEVRLLDKVWNDIREALRRLAPNARVQVERLGDGVVLDGTVESQEELERVLEITRSFVPNFTNMVRVSGSQQVQLEVRIAEVSRSGIKQLGLGFLLNKDWQVAVFPSGSAAGAMTGLREKTLDQSGQNFDSKIASLAADAILASPYDSAFQVLAHGVNNDLLAILSILKGQGLSRLLASPTLVTMSGQEASFLVGGEFPYPVTDRNGNTNVQFKQFGIMLRFTPFVVASETITIKVEPEVSALDYSMLTSSGGTAVPGITTRRGQSTLQLKDGQTFAMAGLLKEETRSAVNKVPFLGDLPVLGTLFTSKEFQASETELVIIVSPRLVRALNQHEVAPLPGANLGRDVSDLDFFLLNRGLSPAGPAPAPGVPKAPRFSGEIGFTQ